MRVLAVTVVHRPDDARIFHREVAALLRAGHSVTLAAPWEATGVSPPDSIRAIDLPRAHDRSRLAALAAARRVIREEVANHDLVMVHDPELLVALGGAGIPRVWDVEEDPAAALPDKAWLPSFLRAPVRALIHATESIAAKRVHLLLADEAYSGRFSGHHFVVPNEPWVPKTVRAPGADRVVHLGRHSVGRGSGELVALGPKLPPGVALHLYGDADSDVVSDLEAAERAHLVTWHGRMANDHALDEIEGALAGLSLLHDLPNYRQSRPTKVVEYMARGVPVITTPLPVAVEIVERHDCGFVVPFGDPQAVADVVSTLVADPDRREELGANGHRAAEEHYNWELSGRRFVAILEGWAGQPARS